MNELDIFEGWPQDYIDEYLAAPTPELYDELNDAAAFRQGDCSSFLTHGGIEYEENNVFDETTGLYKKEFIVHYGTPRHSGRYPYGSGKNPQRHRNWLQRAEDLEKQGLSRVEVAKAMGMSTTDYIAYKSNYKHLKELEDRRQAEKWFYEDQHSKTWIADRLGLSEGTVRNYLDPRKQQREYKAAILADALKEAAKGKPYLDIGEGVNRQLNVSEEQMKKARLLLKEEGYEVVPYKLQQVSNPKQFTNMLILCKGGTTHDDITDHLGEITSPAGIYFSDYGATLNRIKPIPSVDSKRIKVKYAEEGGSEKDGVIEIRPGVEDLSLGGRSYAQVRIAVDGTHYMKGMAIYGDPKTMPQGVDIIYNSHYHEGTPALGSDGDHTVMKLMKKDPNDKTQIDSQNPFGASFRQWEYQDKDGKSHVSPVNIVNDDADWDKWKKNLSSQFLSKQPAQLIRNQLNLKYSEYADELSTLKSITNPTLKKELLAEFADECDSAAAHLKAAALPRQGSYAILPVTSLKDSEVYAPMFKTGEEVVLVRHPHAGTFEIPRLVVNNDNTEGKRVITPKAEHAIGINSTVAKQLSGADYDGDTVLVIPTKGQNIITTKPKASLLDFDPQETYARDPNDPKRTGKSTYKDDGSIDKQGDGFNKQREMGQISNLITDMTLRGAPYDEVERAVKHSMVIIDAEKHNLDWQKSARDNRIEELRYEWQGKWLGKEDGGSASTIVSRSKREVRVPEREEVPTWKMTPEEKERWQNGEVVWRETGKSHAVKKEITDPSIMTPDELVRYNKGKQVYRKTGKIEPNISKMEEMYTVSDAKELSSGTYKEELYAAHANRLKALGNEARKEERATGLLKKIPSAEKAYDDVVGENGSLSKKIALAELEYPKERQAQAIATSIMNAKKQSNPELKDDKDKLKKLSAKALEDARDLVNGGHKKRYRIELSDREWEAIQAGAISNEKMKTIIRYSDKDELKKRATPRQTTGLKSSTKSRARALLASGHTWAEVADTLGVSTTSLRKELGSLSENGLGGD